MSADLDLYEQAGGDAAWQLWFERCAVHRVGEENPTFAAGLAAEIDSAMYGQLSKMGVTKESMNGDVPHLHFDAFFLADSTRKEAEMRKPLKQFYKDRLAAADRSLKEFVCGTIFSSSTGRIRDIARDWVCTVRGWKPHSVKGEDGKRSVIWERALEKEDASARPGGVLYRFGGRIDRETLRTDIAHVFETVSTELGLEKRAIAFLFYTAAQGVSLDQPIILDVLGCKKSVMSQSWGWDSHSRAESPMRFLAA